MLILRIAGHVHCFAVLHGERKQRLHLDGFERLAREVDKCRVGEECEYGQTND